MFTHFCFNNIISIIIFFFFFFFSIFFFLHHRHLSVILFAIFFPLFLSLSTSLLLSFIILFFFFFIIYIEVFPARNLTKNLTKKFDARNMTLKGGTSQACAACKYQRRKCSSECPLAPYFPPDQPKMFQNAHKLFGVSNILKILKNLDANQKSEAMRSIIYQANIRDRFPVHGCWGIICQLHYQIRQAEEDLHTVHTQLEMYRQHHQHQISSLTDDVPSQLELAMAPPSNALSLFGHNTPQTYNAAVNALPISQQHSYSNSSNAGYSSGYLDSKDHLGNSMWVQHPYGTTNNNNNNPMAIQSELVASQPLAIQQEVVQDYDEIHPFFDTIDDRQSYIDSKEAYESSSEESLKDTTQSIEHVADNELKSAAACFSLTSVN